MSYREPVYTMEFIRRRTYKERVSARHGSVSYHQTLSFWPFSASLQGNVFLQMFTKSWEPNSVQFPLDYQVRSGLQWDFCFFLLFFLIFRYLLCSVRSWKEKQTVLRFLFHFKILLQVFTFSGNQLPVHVHQKTLTKTTVVSKFSHSLVIHHFLLLFIFFPSFKIQKFKFLKFNLKNFN